MKTLIICSALTFFTFTAFAANNFSVADTTIKLQADTNNNVYYQRTVKVADNIIIPQIYERILQLMAAKNFTQNYNDDREWKLIFTTTQDLNINRVYVGDDTDGVDPYTVQFAITFDIKNGRYRYTINNVLFFIPNNGFNKRETFSEIYRKATNTGSKRIARNANTLIASFERYLSVLTDDIRQSVERKADMYSSKF